MHFRSKKLCTLLDLCGAKNACSQRKMLSKHRERFGDARFGDGRFGDGRIGLVALYQN